MHHLIRNGLYRAPEPSAKEAAAYKRANAAVKLAYLQGRGKQPLSGDAKLFCERSAYGSNMFSECHQRGLSGLRFDGSTPKRKIRTKVNRGHSAEK